MEKGKQVQEFTPGPWQVSTAKRDGVFVSSSDGFLGVAFAFGDGPTEQDANARLIAAAPELLAALTRLADYTFETGEYLSESREMLQSVVDAAIAKALGK